MIINIGTDLANIGRIEETLKKHGSRFIDRCFSTEEKEKVEGSAKGNNSLRIAGYAKRWAAKEACAKALGLGISNDIYMKDIVVTNNEFGKPQITLSGGALKQLENITPKNMRAKIDVSLTDDHPMAMAFIIISAEEKI